MRSRRWKTLKYVAATLFVFVFVSRAEAGTWAEHAGRLGALQKQMETYESEIKDLIDHKRHANDQKVVKEIVRQIGERHKTLVETAKTYEDMRQHIRFQHPDKNAANDRQYVRYNVKSIEQLENEIGLDGRLDRIKARVLATFPVPEHEQEKKAEAKSRKPASEDQDEDTPDKVMLRK